MKKFFLPAATLAVVSLPALAADLPSRKEPVAAPPPPPMWTGFHIGVNAGGTWGNSTGVNMSSFAVPGSNYTTLLRNPFILSSLNGQAGSLGGTGFIGGGQIGYDMQIPVNGAGFVAGIEADIQGIAASGGGSSTQGVYPVRQPRDRLVGSVTGSGSLSYIGTVRGRLGYLLTPTLLIYGTGGFAYGDVSLNVNSFQSMVTINGVSWNGFGNMSYSQTQTGYTAGGGVEWMFLPNWSAKAEYLYYDLGNVSASGVVTQIPTPIQFTPGGIYAASTVNARIAGNIVRAGVNYHFNWGAPPVVAKY